MNDLPQLSITLSKNLPHALNVATVIKKEVQEQTPRPLLEFVGVTCEEIQQTALARIKQIRKEAEEKEERELCAARKQQEVCIGHAEKVFESVNKALSTASAGATSVRATFDVLFSSDYQQTQKLPMSYNTVVDLLKINDHNVGFLESINAVKRHLYSQGYTVEMSYHCLGEYSPRYGYTFPRLGIKKHVGFFVLTITFPPSFAWMGRPTAATSLLSEKITSSSINDVAAVKQVDTAHSGETDVESSFGMSVSTLHFLYLQKLKEYEETVGVAKVLSDTQARIDESYDALAAVWNSLTVDLQKQFQNPIPEKYHFARIIRQFHDTQTGARWSQ